MGAEQDRYNNLKREMELRELHHFEAEAILSEIQNVLKPEWLHGRVLPAYLGAENAARISAIKTIMQRWDG